MTDNQWFWAGLFGMLFVLACFGAWLWTGQDEIVLAPIAASAAAAGVGARERSKRAQASAETAKARLEEALDEPTAEEVLEALPREEKEALGNQLLGGLDDDGPGGAA